MSEEDEKKTLDALSEQHRQLLARRQQMRQPGLECAEELRRNALRVLDTSALTAAIGIKPLFTDLAKQLQPMQAFYDSAGLSRAISESVLAAYAAHKAVIDTSWVKNAIPPMFSGKIVDELVGLSFARPAAFEQLRAITGAYTTNYFQAFVRDLQLPLKQWRELFDGYDEDEQRLLAAIVPLGWLISPSMELHTIREFAGSIENLEELDEALVGYFGHERCQAIIEALYGDPDFAELRPLIEEGLESHKDGRYRAAILVWMAVVDGVTKRKYNVSVFSESKRKRSGRLRQILERASGSHDGLREALIEILQRVSIKAPDPHMPKRDLVMHGAEVDFGNERASIQLILVLEVLHFCAPAIEGEAA